MKHDVLFLLLGATLAGFIVGQVVIALLNRLVFP